MGKELSHVLNTKNNFVSAPHESFLSIKVSFCFGSSLSLPHFLRVLVFVHMCDDLSLHIFSFPQSSGFFSLNWYDQLPPLKRTDILFLIFCCPLLSEHPTSHQVCLLLLPPVRHHVPLLKVLGWYFLGLLTHPNICLLHAMTWRWLCFLVSSDEELAFWYLLSSLLWEWHLEDEVTLET